MHLLFNVTRTTNASDPSDHASVTDHEDHERSWASWLIVVNGRQGWSCALVVVYSTSMIRVLCILMLVAALDYVNGTIKTGEYVN
jgi:hypothetical protein